MIFGREIAARIWEHLPGNSGALRGNVADSVEMCLTRHVEPLFYAHALEHVSDSIDARQHAGGDGSCTGLSFPKIA
jgi:hypothetical protein